MGRVGVTPILAGVTIFHLDRVEIWAMVGQVSDRYLGKGNHE